MDVILLAPSNSATNLLPTVYINGDLRSIANIWQYPEQAWFTWRSNEISSISLKVSIAISQFKVRVIGPALKYVQAFELDINAIIANNKDLIMRDLSTKWTSQVLTKSEDLSNLNS